MTQLLCIIYLAMLPVAATLVTLINKNEILFWPSKFTVRNVVACILWPMFFVLVTIETRREQSTDLKKYGIKVIWKL